jgi:NAD(P)-dependent dehydrogenase (short-subunit alcohol dehydrogenase family)
MNNATQKVVLVTGASSGIGKCCAEHLLGCGYRVFGTQRRAPSAQPPASPAVEMIQMDVDQDSSVADGVQAIMERAGRLDVVINNAGWGLMGAVEETAIDEAKAQMETNFFGVLRVCRAALPIMRRQGGGTIINISSLAGIVGLPFSGMYSASKFALEGVTESLRLETRRQNIRVVLVEPGDFRSSFPQARRLTRASSVQGPYSEIFERIHKTTAADEAKAPTPESIGLLVEKIIQHPNPRLRYPIGLLSQRIVVPLKRILPQRLFEWLFCKVMGV